MKRIRIKEAIKSLLRKVFLTTKNTKLAQSSQRQTAEIYNFVFLVKTLCEPCGKFFRLFGGGSIKKPFAGVQKIVAATLCVACVLFFTVSGCGKQNSSEPIEIPLTVYSLYGTGCRWVESDPDKVIIINNSKEFKKYITCEDVVYPEIDFRKQTLLLINSVSYRGPCEVNSTFFQVGSKKYTWKVSVRIISAATVVSYWHEAILVPKLSNNATIKFDKSEI